MQSIRIYSFAIACCLAFCIIPSEDAQAQVEFEVKNTFGDIDDPTSWGSWNQGSMTSPLDAASIYSPSLDRPDELRYYFGFTSTASGTLQTLSFPLGFVGSSSPSNSPTSNPYLLSIKLFVGLDDLNANPTDIDGIIGAPSNTDWINTILTSINGSNVWFHEWDLSSFGYEVVAGQTYYLAANAIAPNGSFDEQPTIPQVTDSGSILGGEDDYFLFEGIIDPAIPVGDFYGFDQAAVRLTAISMEVLLGDINCDGAVNLLDVAPFVDLISSGEFSPKGDFDSDGAVNLLDVAPFVNAIAGG